MSKDELTDRALRTRAAALKSLAILLALGTTAVTCVATAEEPQSSPKADGTAGREATATDMASLQPAPVDWNPGEVKSSEDLSEDDLTEGTFGDGVGWGGFVDDDGKPTEP